MCPLVSLFFTLHVQVLMFSFFYWCFLFEIAFDERFSSKLHSLFFTLDVTSTIIYGMDAVFRVLVFKNTFRTSEVIHPQEPDSQSKPVLKHRSMASQWCSFWFLLDLIAAIPWNLCFGNQLLRSLRGLKFFRCHENFRVLIYVLEKKRVITHAGSRRVLVLSFYYLLLVHLVACFWFIIGWGETEKGLDSWIREDSLSARGNHTSDLLLVSPAHAYVRALYWATITMVCLLQCLVCDYVYFRSLLDWVTLSPQEPLQQKRCMLSSRCTLG